MRDLLAFPLCDQVVTVYRQEGENISRQVLADCFYRIEDALQDGWQRKFLLVVPGTEVRLRLGDRVLPGEGPQVALEDWKRFVPAAVEGLGQVGYVKPYPTHTEAGN